MSTLVVAPPFRSFGYGRLSRLDSGQNSIEIPGNNFWDRTLAPWRKKKLQKELEELDPRDVDMLHHLAYTYLDLNQPANAAEQFEKIFHRYDVFGDPIAWQSHDAYFISGWHLLTTNTGRE